MTDKRGPYRGVLHSLTRISAVSAVSGFISVEKISTVGSTPSEKAVPPQVTAAELKVLRDAARKAQSRYAHALRQYKRQTREARKGLK